MANKKSYIPALGYDWLTSFYDLTIKLTMPENKIRTKLLNYIAPKSDEKILEFGFGTGQNIVHAKQMNYKATYVGLDIDPKVKQIAKRKFRQHNIDCRLDLYDGFKFPYVSNYFDKVFSCLVFHQLDKENKLLCLKEIHRVLKPNGQLIIGDWGKAKTKIMRMSFYTVQILDGFKTTNDNVKGYLPNYINQAGFNDTIEFDYINTSLGTFSFYKAIK